MSTQIGEVFVNIGAALGDLYKGFDKAKSASGQFEKQSEKIFKNIGTKIAAALSVAAAVKFFVDSTKAAIDATETNQKFAVTFDEVSVKAEEAAKNLAANYGLAKTEAKSMLAATGDLLTGLGVQKDTALDLSVQTQQLATDLASFSNYAGGAKGASEALTKAMLGEREQIKSLGIVITEEMMKDELAAEGKSKLTGLALKQAQAHATLKLATEQSKNAIGDFARSMDSPSNVIRRVNAQLQNFKEEVGENIAPALGRLGQAFLNASKDGGFFQDVIKRLSKIIAYFIDSITILINLLQGSKISDEMDRLNDVIEKSSKAYKALRQEQLTYQQQLKEGKISQQEYNFQMEALDVAMKTNIKDRERLSNEYSRNAQELEKLSKINEQLKNGVETETAAVNASTKAKAQNTEQVKASEEAIKALKKEREKWLDLIDKYNLSEMQLADKQYKEELRALEEAYQKKILTQKEYQAASEALAKEHSQSIVASMSNIMNTLGDFAYNIAGSVSELLDMSSENQSIAIENNLTKDLNKLEKWYKKQKATINSTVKDRKSRDKAISKLDEEYEDKKSAYQEKADKKEAKLKRQAAKRSKDIAIFDAVISTATGAIQAYQSMLSIPVVGSVLGAIAAAAVVAFGAVKIALIESQPLPAAAEGMYSERPAIFGEAGPEIAVPLTSARGKAAISLLASGLIEAMAEKTGASATISSTKETVQTIKGDVILYGEKIGKFISDGTKNGQILISARAVI